MPPVVFDPRRRQRLLVVPALGSRTIAAGRKRDRGLRPRGIERRRDSRRLEGVPAKHSLTAARASSRLIATVIALAGR